MTASPQPVLLYDGECPMCQGVVKRLHAFGLTRTVTVLPAQEADWLSEELMTRSHSEILMVNRETEEVLGGVEVMIRLLERHPLYHWLGRLMALPVLKGPLAYFYRLVAMNRRILSPIPPRPIPCTCDPPDDPKARSQFYTWLLLLLCLNIAIALSSQLTMSRRLSCLYSLLLEVTTLSFLIAWLLSTCILQPLKSPQFKLFVQQTFVLIVIYSLWLAVLSLITLCYGSLNLLPLIYGLSITVFLVSGWKRFKAIGLPRTIRLIFLVAGILAIGILYMFGGLCYYSH